MSNLTLRILTAIVAIPLIVIICLAGGIYFFGFVSLASAIALIEFYQLTKTKGAAPLVAIAVAAGFFINLTFYFPQLQTFLFDQYAVSARFSIPYLSQSQILLITFIVIIAVISLVELFRNKGSALLNLSATLMGLFYISFFFGTFVGIRELFSSLNFPMLQYFHDQSSFTDPVVIERVYRWGGYMVISIFAIIWICDTAAFHVGTIMGRHKLFPRVSPNKSWEGAIAGFIFALLSAVAAQKLVLEFLSMGDALVIGFIVGVFGQLGDLLESLFKRDAGVKDSSSLIPGHGGVFDRFDSLLLVSPLVYLYLDLIVFH